MKGQLSFQYSYAFKSKRKANLCTVLLQSFGFSLLLPCCFTDIIFTRNRFYLVVLPVQLFFKSFWLLTLDQSQCLFMHAPAQQDVNKNAFHAQVGSSPLHNCPRARWSSDLAFSLNVSETLNPVIHPLGKDSQMLVFIFILILIWQFQMEPNCTFFFLPKARALDSQGGNARTHRWPGKEFGHFLLS